MNRSLNRRLALIEGQHSNDDPHLVLMDRPEAYDGEKDDLCRNWRDHVASGAASMANGVLCVMGASMTEDEWERSHCVAGR